MSHPKYALMVEENAQLRAKIEELSKLPEPGIVIPSFPYQVAEFNHKILGIEQRIPGYMTFEEENITIKCLNEEVEEFVLSIAESNYVGSIDALIDLMYFAMGALYKLGLTPDQIERCCTAVHEANMSKKRGINAKRETGAADAVKPIDWIPPEERIRSIISESREK